METVVIQVKNDFDAQKLIRYSIDNGWNARSFNSLLDQFIDTAPKDVPITDEEIMTEIKNFRQNGSARHF